MDRISWRLIHRGQIIGRGSYIWKHLTSLDKETGKEEAEYLDRRHKQ